MIPGIGILSIQTKVAATTDGKYMVAVADNDYVWVSSDYGQTWNSKEMIRAWRTCSISGDGKYILASTTTTTYLSRDSGESFNSISSSAPGYSYGYAAAMSADGKYIYCRSSNYIKRSTDFGATFTTMTYYMGNKYLLRCSHDGKYVLGFWNQYTESTILLSSDYGVTFVAKTIPKDTYAAIYGMDISKDGKYIAAAVYQGNSAVSCDYGANWTITSLFSNSSACVSGSGQYMALGGDYSVNYGLNWTGRAVGYGNHIECSFSGQYFAFHTTATGFLKVSSNYGNTYANVASSKAWKCISIGKVIS